MRAIVSRCDADADSRERERVDEPTLKNGIIRGFTGIASGMAAIRRIPSGRGTASPGCPCGSSWTCGSCRPRGPCGACRASRTGSARHAASARSAAGSGGSSRAGCAAGRAGSACGPGRSRCSNCAGRTRGTCRANWRKWLKSVGTARTQADCQNCRRYFAYQPGSLAIKH